MALKIREYQPGDKTAIIQCMRELQEWERAIDARLAPADDVLERLWREILQDCDVFRGTLPERLFEGVYDSTAFPYFEVSPDAQSFLVFKQGEAQRVTELIVVENWFEEPKRLVPTD